MKSRVSLYLCRRNLYPLTALLLSFLLIAMPFVQITLASSGVRRHAGNHSSGSRVTIATEKQNYRANPNAAVPAPAPEPLVPSITATKVDTLIADDGDNKADPGGTEKIEYNITITNNGTDAADVVFSDDIDDHTTLVPGSINTQPIADPDTYTASGNIAISKNAAGGVLANDRDPDTGNNTPLTVSKVQGVSGNVGVATDTTATGRGGVKGSVTLASDGSFTYEPPPGFTGADSFTYEVTDGTKIDTATVNITISGMVWFISNNAGGLNRGTFSHPFTSIGSFNAANAASGNAPDPKNGDIISLRTGTGTYTEADGVNLRAQQRLIGNGIQFNTVFTASADSIGAYNTFAGAAGVAPDIITTNGNGVDLSTDNHVRGLDIGNTPGFFKINGSAVGSPTINTINLTGTGGALNVSTSGAFGGNVTFATLESTSSPAANVNLVGVTGTLGITGVGAGLSNSAAGSAAVNVSGGSVAFTYGGNVSKANAGALISISGGHSAGVITFQTGTLSATTGTGFQFDNADGQYNFNGTNTLAGGDAGIDILNNSSGTFNFSAASTISSPTGTAFNVGSSPGNPTVTYSGSITDNTAGQRAVNIDGTTGGSISIASVTTASVAGGTGNTGININNANGNVSFTTLTMGTAATRHTAQPVTITNGTGTYSLGTANIFTNNVTGIGSTNADGTLNSTTGTVDTNGGTTVHIDGPAGLTTLGMTFTKLLSDGGTSTGLIVQDTNGSFTVAGSGSACTSSATCTGGSLSGKSGSGLGGSGTDGVFLRNAVNVSLTRMNLSDNNGNGLFAGSVNGIRIDNCFINSNADALTGADYLSLGFNNEANVHLVNISGSTLAGANPTAITNSTITNAFEHDIEIDQTTGTLTDFQINNSTINNNGASGQANNRVLYIMNGGPGVTGTVTVQDSTLTGNRTVGALTAAGIQATVSAGTQNIRVFRNTLLNHNVAVDVSASTSGVLNFDISNNGGSGGVANNGASNGRIVGSDSVAVSVFTAATATGSVNGFIQGNTIGTQGVVASGSVNGRGIQFQNEGSVNSKVLISGNIVQGVAGNQELNIQHGIAVAGAAGRSDVIAINNTLRENTSQTRPFNAEILNTGTLCVDIAGNTFANNIGQGGTASLLRVNDPAGTGTMLVRQLTPSAAANANELDDANGLSFAAGQVTVSGAPTFNGGACTQPTVFSSLMSDSGPGNVTPPTGKPKVQRISATIPEQPTSGANAQLNATALTQQSFLTRAANAIVAFASEVQSLIEPTAHASSETPRNESGPATSINVTQPAEVRTQSVSANTGRQKLTVKPADGRSRKTNSHHATLRTRALMAAAMSGENVTRNIGTLRAGDSVTITFQVTVDNPPNLTLLNPPRVSNQGTVSGSNFSNVLTDDPALGGVSDPTLTEVDLFNTTTTLVSDLNPSDFGDMVTFTATVAEDPDQPSLAPTGTVDFIDTSNGNAVICDDVALTGTTAQCQTSTLTPGTHNIRADYSGDGNYDPSQSNIVAQVVNACTQDPIVTTTADGGAGSLREALSNVCSGDTITFNIAGAGPHTITLTSGELLVDQNVTVNNNSGESITVSGNNLSRVFNVDTGITAAIIGLTISGGNATGDGAGISNNGDLTVVNSTLSGNAAGADGGAIATTATGTSLTVINTTISGNSAGGSGGGVIVLGGIATFVNVTVTNNTADSDNNAAGSGGGIRAHAGTTTLKNTIVAGNFNEDGASDAADDISGTVDAASSFNLIGTGGAGGLTNGVNNNQVGVADAGLGSLGNNGGTTQTHALLPTSAAVETGGNANLPADTFDLDGDTDTGETLPVDQRGTGFPRNADSQDANTTQTVDIGAFELHPSIEDIPNQTTAEDTPKLVTFNLGDDTGSLIATVTATSSNTALVTNDSAHLSFSGSGGSRTLTITPNTDANGLTAGGTTTITVTVTATNGRTAVDTFDLTVTEVNDAPTFQLGPNPSVAEDAGPQTINGFAFNFQPGPATATDESGQTLVGYTVTPTGSTGGLTFSAAPAISNSGTLTFTADNDSSGTATFDVVATDSGPGTPPNVNQSAPVSFTITVGAVNDPPVNTVPGPQGTNQDTPLTFSGGNQISVADPDAGANTIQVTLTATNGTITLSGISGLSFSFTDANGTGTGDGTADPTMTFRGTIANINNALNGMFYTPTSGFSGAASLTITSNDLGNTGSGGPQTDTDVVNIQVSTNINIQDAQVAEPPSGSVDMIFTVTLTGPAPATGTSVDFTTVQQAPASDHATAGSDYTTTSGTVNFAAGEQVKTIAVPVLADAQTSEVNETFLVVLSNPVNGTLVDDTATGTILVANQPGTLLISELRTSGPGGAGDDFVEIYNNSDSSHTVAATDGSAGYGLFKMGAACGSAPVLIGVIPNGTEIPARGHFLFAGSAYSLTAYGALDLSLSEDIESDRNVGFFSTSSLASISTARRFDAVGFGANMGDNCDLLREGTTLTPMVGSVLEHSYVRDECGKGGNPETLNTCPSFTTKDTNSNSADFVFVETTAVVTPAGQRLGAPGPQGINSPRLNTTTMFALLLDVTKSANAAPNRVRDTGAIGPNASAGTLTVRRRFVNTTGAPVTRLRFRIIDISAFTTNPAIADLRGLTSTSVVISGITDSGTCLASNGSATTPCTVTVEGSTLEVPPNQPLGGALNSSFNAGTITLATPLASGASLNLQFVLGVERSGLFKFFFNMEALP
jgi:Bacterial Ig-like domain (group 3)/Bacterial Ig domain/Calx-beta domain